MRFAERKSLGIALIGQPIHHRATRIAQAHHFGAFIKCLTGRIVDGLPDYLHLIIGTDLDNLRISSRYQETQEGERGRMIILRTLFNEMSQHMSLKMIDLDHRDSQRRSEALRERGTD